MYKSKQDLRAHLRLYKKEVKTGCESFRCVNPYCATQPNSKYKDLQDAEISKVVVKLLKSHAKHCDQFPKFTFESSTESLDDGKESIELISTAFTNLGSLDSSF